MWVALLARPHIFCTTFRPHYSLLIDFKICLRDRKPFKRVLHLNPDDTLYHIKHSLPNSLIYLGMKNQFPIFLTYESSIIIMIVTVVILCQTRIICIYSFIKVQMSQMDPQLRPLPRGQMTT